MRLTGRWVSCAVILLLAIQAAQVVFMIHRESLTWDEDDHMFAGYMMWKAGDYGLNPEHPPLVKLLATLPLLGEKLWIPPSTGREFKAEAYLNGRDWLARNDGAVPYHHGPDVSPPVRAFFSLVNRHATHVLIERVGRDTIIFYVYGAIHVFFVPAEKGGFVNDLIFREIFRKCFSARLVGRCDYFHAAKFIHARLGKNGDRWKYLQCFDEQLHLGGIQRADFAVKRRELCYYVVVEKIKSIHTTAIFFKKLQIASVKNGNIKYERAFHYRFSVSLYISSRCFLIVP